jgi:hypothetical protein
MDDNRETLSMLDTRASIIAGTDGVIMTLILTALDRLEDFLKPAYPISTVTLLIVSTLLAVSMFMSMLVIAPRKTLLRPAFTTLDKIIEELIIFNKEVEKIIKAKIKLIKISFYAFASAMTILLSLFVYLFYIYFI